MSHPNEPPPAFRAPPLARDAHFHIFGPADRYSYGTGTEKLRYAPPLAPLSDYLMLAELLGIERFVFVQPSAYGRDNACMLDAMREIESAAAAHRGRGRARPGRAARGDECARRAGRADQRFTGQAAGAGLLGDMLPRIERLDARCAEIGWQLDFLHPGWLTEELLPVFARLRCSFTIAHMGMFRAEAAEPAGFRARRSRCARQRTCLVKLTGTYRMADGPTFADAAPMARALIAAAPERLIWGSDYPHLSLPTRSARCSFSTCWATGRRTKRRGDGSCSKIPPHCSVSRPLVVHVVTHTGSRLLGSVPRPASAQ